MSWKSKARAKRAEILSQQMRHGDSAAAFSLLQRGRALKSLKSGYRWKLELATAARKRAEAKLAVEKRAEQRRLSEQCTFKDEKVLDAFRARYGCGVFGSSPDSQCKSVAPVGVCPNCSWQWGDLEPHTIGYPAAQKAHRLTNYLGRSYPSRDSRLPR